MWREHTSLTGVVVMLCALIAPSVFAPRVRAATAGPVLIVEVQTGSRTSASEEYVELVNISTAMVQLDGARLEYFSANPKSTTQPSRTISLSGSISSGAHFVVASTGYRPDAQLHFAPTLAAAGGHLRLVGPAGEWDFVGWGTAANARGSAAGAPAPGQQLQRITHNDTYQTTGNNSQDFRVSDGIDTTPTVPDNAMPLDGLVLSELFPDPATPQTDAQHEFIEIYNSSSHSIDLSGLRLVSGTITTKSFSLPAGQLSPGGYQVYFASQTKLVLGNNGGRVQLLTALGDLLDQASYSKPLAGVSWAKQGDEWQWTSRPTPGQANELVELDQPSGTIGATTSKVSVKKASKKSTKKVTKPSTKKPTKSRSGNVKSAATNQPAQASAQANAAPLHNGVIAGVGGLAVLYGAYEYRHDVINLYHKLRGNRKTR